MTCSAHAHQRSWMRPNTCALVHRVHGVHCAVGTLFEVQVHVLEHMPLCCALENEWKELCFSVK